MPISGKMYVWGERAKFVPEEAGVYALYDEKRVLIHVGGSPNLRETFNRCLDTKFSNDHRKRETKYYRRESTPNWEERLEELVDECSLKQEEPPQKEATRDWGFYFYEDVNRPLFEAAFNLEDFREKVRKVPVASLDFHQKRGDFSKWIRDVFKETQLAERIEGIYNTGEDLRRELLNAFQNGEAAECPRCGTQTTPRKIWKMAGRPRKTGERLQLTIALYTCNNCNKTFRKAIKKEEIKPAN